MNTHHVTPSVWAPPQLSMRWWPVFLRNLLVWRKLAIPSLVGNIAEPLMWLVAFGYGLGALVGEVNTGGQQVPYILFLASGSICMSAMNAASFEALYSAFSRMHVQKTSGNLPFNSLPPWQNRALSASGFVPIDRASPAWASQLMNARFMACVASREITAILTGVRTFWRA